MLTVERKIKDSVTRFKNLTHDWQYYGNYRTMTGAKKAIERLGGNFTGSIYDYHITGTEEARRCSNKSIKAKDANVKVGSVFVGMHGYDATFYDAYVVTGITPSGLSVRVRPLCKESRESDGNCGYCSWNIGFIKPKDSELTPKPTDKCVRLTHCGERVGIKHGYVYADLEPDFDYAQIFTEDDYH